MKLFTLADSVKFRKLDRPPVMVADVNCTLAFSISGRVVVVVKGVE